MTIRKKTLDELGADIKNELGNMLAGIARLEQSMAEQGMIPTARCPQCHGTGVVSIGYASEEEQKAALGEHYTPAADKGAHSARTPEERR